MSRIDMALKPGQRVRVEQRIARREGDWVRSFECEVLDVLREPTGSWFARQKNGKLWLNRIRVRKDNGELTTLTVDQHTKIEVLPGAESESRTG